MKSSMDGFPPAPWVCRVHCPQRTASTASPAPSSSSAWTPRPAPRRRSMSCCATPTNSAAGWRPGGISAEPTGDVVFRQLLLRVGKNQSRRADFDQVAEMEIRGALRYPRRLLHIVRHDDDGVVRAQFIDQI